MDRLKRIGKSKWFWIIVAIIAILSVTIAYHTSWKALPEGISYEGEKHQMENIEFFRDLTYEDEAGKTVHDLQVFEEINRTIGEAEDFIVADMFLFNGYTNGKNEFPDISSNLVDAILKRKEEVPDLKVVFITDQINTVYGSYQSETIQRLEDGGVDVVLTNLNKLRDSNPLYSSVWRLLFSWMGTGENGWISNPMAKEAPDVTLRSYMKLLNIKANHRKILVTEKSAIVSTANPHDASGYHENVAFKMTGPIIKDILEAEEAVVNYSGEADFPDYEDRTWEEQEGPLTTQFVTEGKIYRSILDELSAAGEGDTVWLGMYYLADKKITSSLDDAANRGATVNIVMDPNKKAFGHEKTGIPNLPVAAELKRLGNENIHLRWYDVNIEQYHTKMLYIDHPEEDVIIAGSANYTRRNLSNLNLEADVVIKGNGEEQVFTEVNDYFTRIWNNEEGHYTADYKEYQDNLTFIRYATYYLQKWTWFTTY
ncbi:phospholipase D family protein [Halobacillus sp. GSS1]|uniref:phospholipase D family protein n=1 Tax=Halobacillus sp. GSS1 TaxID=2815919 RepID=UPI001A8F21D3|nr:phospholipase D family protein [Halobacillus sp. GSS1]MBN9654256.1 phospholipase D family protein [Halobacillus sp. GSS1]